MLESTLVIIKPNAMKKNVIGAIIQKFEENHLQLSDVQLMQLTEEQCQEFYAEHKERGFFSELVEFMSSHRVLLMLLSGENAVVKARKVMGATDPAMADPGTIRKLYGDSVGENAVHGSDSRQAATREIQFFNNLSK